jgi:acyl-CoA thioesterase-1
MKIPLEKKALSTILSDRSLKADYIHPNAAGYRKLAELVTELLRKSGGGG